MQMFEMATLRALLGTPAAVGKAATAKAPQTVSAQAFLKQVSHMHNMDTDGAADPGATQVQLEAYMTGHGVDLRQVQEVLDKAREEACAWRAQRQKQYQEWLEGACEGGMRGLYRAL